MNELEKKMEERWFIPRKRYVPCLWPAHTYWAWPVHVFFGKPTTGTVISVWEKGDYVVLFERQTTWVELSQAVADKILSQSGDLEALRQGGIKAGEETVAFCKNFAEKSAEASVQEYIDFFDEFTKKYSLIMRDNMHYWVMGTYVIEDMVKKQISTSHEQEAEEIFLAMHTPTEDSYSKKIDDQIKNIIKIAQTEGLDSEKVKNLIKEFSANYFWFPYEYVGPKIWDESAIIEMVRKSLVENSNQEVSSEADNSTRQKECITKYALPEEVVKLFDILQTLTLMADDRKRYNSEICYFVNGIIFTNLAQKLGVSRDDALYINQDLLRVFLEDKDLFLKKLTNRTEMLVEVIKDGKSLWHEGREEGDKILKSLDVYLATDENISEIKGQVAYKGKVTGRVRLLKTSQVENFEDGDILVTGMTTPDFISLIKRAGAIITNEGGITCHAAIISRELKKPCITGTHIATQVLKDGDMVEVDADNGIVRIIK